MNKLLKKLSLPTVKLRISFGEAAVTAKEVEALRAELSAMRERYAIFEELAPPAIPRKKFAELCFRAWEELSSQPGSDLSFANKLDDWGYFGIADAVRDEILNGPVIATDFDRIKVELEALKESTRMIPVEEKMPATGEDVLVTVYYTSLESSNVTVGCFFKGDWRDESLRPFSEIGAKVIAWCNKPEPYGGNQG